MNKIYYILTVILLYSSGLNAQFWEAESPAPDEYGYTWRTNLSDVGPTYNWIDISEIGTEVTDLSDDNVVGPFNMGIDFQYYWVNYREIYIGSNGYVSFQNANIASTNGFPATPTPDRRNDVIAPFLADLSPDGVGNPGKVYYFSDIDSQRFIVSYLDMPFWANQAVVPEQYRGSNSFQVILDARDSSITFQYAKQEGDWDDGYNDSPNPMVVGIENITGQIGLLVTNNIKPLPGTALKFNPPATVLLSIPDVAPQALLNSTSSGTIIPPADPLNPQFRLSARIANTGNVAIETPIDVNASVRDTTGQLVFQQNVNVPSLQVDQEETITFSIPFNPPLPGPYLFEVTTSNVDDINSLNNQQVSEIVVVDTTGAKGKFSYSSGNPFNIDGLISWTGNNDDSGGGVFFEAYGYPVIVDTLSFLLGVDNTSPNPPSRGFRMEIFQGDPTLPPPGQLVYTKDVTLEELLQNTDSIGWTNIAVDQSVAISEGGFYVSWIQLDPVFFLFTETASPISRQTFEVLNGKWAQYRQVNEEDFFIRASVDLSFAVATSIKDDIVGLQKFNLYPNPNDGRFKIELSLESPLSFEIIVRDIQGKKLYRSVQEKTTNYIGELILPSLTPGVYILEVVTTEGKATKKMVLSE